MEFGKLNPYNNAKISFPGFQEILNFTATGSESSVSVAVDGDTDKEYIFLCRATGAFHILVRLNGDSGNNYAYRYIFNNAGTISVAGAAQSQWGLSVSLNGIHQLRVLTPAGFIKTASTKEISYSSGTTISQVTEVGFSYNSTSNITSFGFRPNTGTFSAGTNIKGYARRSN